jgi:DNA-binding GntR family transcriptional regulator
MVRLRTEARMTAFEELRRHILFSQKSDPGGSIYHQPIQLAVRFGLPERLVKEVFRDMKDEGLITLTANGASLVVTLTARGAELLAEIPVSAIGFNSK